MAVHPFDSEGRLGVQLADRARAHEPSSTCVRAWFKQLEDVMVVDGVIGLPSLPAHPHQAQRAKQPELVGHGGFTDPDGSRQVADADLTLPEGLEDSESRRIAKHPKRFRHGFHVGGAHHL